MTSKAETTFAASVNNWLKGSNIYFEKMNNPYRGGTPDFYYEGPNGSKWVEYKFIVVPKRDSTLIVPDLTALQLAWLKRNFENGNEPWVVIGHRAGGVVMAHPQLWEEGLRCDEFLDHTVSRDDIALEIHTALA